MKSSRFLLAPVLSLFDLSIYREARREKFGTGVLYSLYLSGLFCLALGVLSVVMMPRADAFVDWLKNEWPGLTLTPTGMKLDTPGRVTLTHPQYGALMTLDDSVETITESDMGAAKLFITSTNIYTQTSKGLQVRPLPKTAANVDPKKNAAVNVHIEGQMLKTNYQRFKWAVVGVFLVTMFIFGFISRLITSLIFGLVGFLIQLAFPRGLDFEKLFILAAFSLSVGLIFGILQYVPMLGHFFPGGLGIVLCLAYFGIAIAVQPKLTTPVVE